MSFSCCPIKYLTFSLTSDLTSPQHLYEHSRLILSKENTKMKQYLKCHTRKLKSIAIYWRCISHEKKPYNTSLYLTTIHRKFKQKLLKE